MARLSTSPVGATLRPGDFERPEDKRPTTRRKAPTVAVPAERDQPEPTHCEACGGEQVHAVRTLRRKGLGVRWDPWCKHCQLMFGNRALQGVTNLGPDEVRKRLLAVKERGFLIVLRELNLSALDGHTLIIEPGDIFPVQHTPADPAQEPGQCSKERTWRLFTMPLQVGKYQTVLFGHEFNGIALDRVLAMKRSGEISETFVSTEDNVGHFTPRPDLVEAAKAVFGSLLGVSPEREVVEAGDAIEKAEG